jgi:hypothetical protein
LLKYFKEVKTENEVFVSLKYFSKLKTNTSETFSSREKYDHDYCYYSG